MFPTSPNPNIQDYIDPFKEMYDTHRVNSDYEFAREIESLAKRAKSILLNRSPEQVRSVTDMLGWLLSEAARMEYTQKWLAASENENEGGDHSGIGKLFHHHESIDIGGLKEFPDATWAEFFAILALWKIDSAVGRWGGFDFPLYGTAEKIVTALGISHLISQATEALSYAECFAKVQPSIKSTVTEDTKKIILRENVKIINDFRHAKSREVKVKWLDYFYVQRSNFPSDAATTRAYLTTLPPEEFMALGRSKSDKPQNPERALLDYLRAHRKELREKEGRN